MRTLFLAIGSGFMVYWFAAEVFAEFGWILGIIVLAGLAFVFSGGK